MGKPRFGTHPSSLILGLFWLLGSPLAPAAGTDPEIEFLLQSVAESEYRFLRNGEAHAGPEAADHLRKKYEYRRDRIGSAEAFIDQIASGSWLSGEPYRVQKPDGGTELTRDWLRARLAEYRRRPEQGDAR